jgi:RHS repeat-associated protein
VSWVHQDPFAKSKRVTNSSGNVVSIVELDPWGGDTTRSSNSGFQPRLFTTYDRDGNQSDEAMHRRYNRWHARFDQPDPYGGSMRIGDPQSFNRYSYVQNDPVNFVDPTGLFTNCGQNGLPPCPRDNPWEDLPSSSPVPLFFPIETGGEADPGGGGGGGGANHEAGHSEPQNTDLDDVQLETCTEDSNGALASLRREATFTLQTLAQQRPGSPPIRPFFSPDFARRLSNAIIELNSVGIVPQINDAFRTAADQKWYQTHGAGGGRPVNMGISDHQAGNAVDINSVTLAMNAILQKHGLSPVKNDPPHFKIGVQNVSDAASRAEEYYWKHCASLLSDPSPSP